MAGISVIFLLCHVIITGVFATDYCKLESCTSPHTMCLYKSPNPASACLQPNNAGLIQDEKDAIVRKHNELRQKVASGKETRGINGPQPPAVSMPDLTWDNELETIAQRWANQCDFSHDKCRDSERFAVGQNIAMRMAMGQQGDNKPDLEKMVQSWYDEVALFNKNDIRKFVFSMKTGHYTQLIWAETTMIGCGRIKYKKEQWTTHYLVCNYGPSGNYIRQPIYKVKQ